MAYTIEASTDSALTLDACIDALGAIDGVWRRDRIDDAALLLRQLSNDRRFLVDAVTRELLHLDDIDGFQAASSFSQQIVDLGGGAGFRLRANMWPQCTSAEPLEWEKSLFAYHMPHDHNADFLTVGYWGPGYETEIYEYDSDRTAGFDGEPVELTFLERTRLTPGKIMFYRANRDIHTQLPSDAFSVSINLLAADPESLQSARQYWFDVENGRIDRSVDRLDYTPYVFLCRLASHLGDGNTTDAMESIARGHVDPRVRGEAYRALSTLDARDAGRHWRHAASDTDAYVRRMGREMLADAE